MAICPFATWDEINGPSNSYTGGPFRIVHHVTDGSDYPRSTYAERKNEPHFTVTSTRIYQHVDTAKASRALKNPPGGVETNRLSAVQIEVVGYSGKPKNRDTLRNMARLCRWIEATHGIPRCGPTATPGRRATARIPAATTATPPPGARREATTATATFPRTTTGTPDTSRRSWRW
ncbi:MAG: N-acetylmuramoyl-L-alanine amidase [Longimicrobiaceae bacterium]